MTMETKFSGVAANVKYQHNIMACDGIFESVVGIDGVVRIFTNSMHPAYQKSEDLMSHFTRNIAEAVADHILSISGPTCDRTAMVSTVLLSMHEPVDYVSEKPRRKPRSLRLRKAQADERHAPAHDAGDTDGTERGGEGRRVRNGQ